MKVGIVGLPNVGKSTLFSALTKKEVARENYPFCTIDPNVGVTAVPDSRLFDLVKVSSSAQEIPAVIEFVDIAGLVKNAHQGEGLGNQFLSHIREVDAIIEVLRDFEDKNVTHVEGSVDAGRDLDIIHLELVMADLQTVEKILVKVIKEAKSGDKQLLKKQILLEKLKKVLAAGKLASELEMDAETKKEISSLNLLTLKPIIYVLNIDQEKGAQQGFKKIAEGVHLITIDAKLEAELVGLPESEVQEYLHELGIERTGLDQLIVASYQILNLITFFTSGEKESRAWTVTKGSTAPMAAGRIHTDFIKGFIRAEVVDFDNFIAAGGWQGVKEKGLVRQEGKEYVVADGDVIYFKVAT